MLMVSGDFDHVRLGALRLVDQHGTGLSKLVAAKMLLYVQR